MEYCPLLQVAKALVEFETLWHQAWLKGIEQQRAGLQAPLLVRHPDTGQLLVNLDKELMQLIRWDCLRYTFLELAHLMFAARRHQLAPSATCTLKYRRSFMVHLVAPGIFMFQSMLCPVSSCVWWLVIITLHLQQVACAWSASPLWHCDWLELVLLAAA